MPVRVERRLKRKATQKGLKGERYRAYVYGTLASIQARSRKRGTRRQRRKG